MIDAVIEFAHAHLSPEGIQVFSERALWAAAESQKATAIPALTLVASLSLLAVLAWVAIAAGIARFALKRIRMVKDDPDSR